jgi:hypothetical protein
MQWPHWWQWELELTPHLMKRMIDRGFNEAEPMQTRYLEITYRHGRPLAAYLYLPRRVNDRSARVEQHAGGLVVDLTEDDRPIGLELTDPRSASLDEVNGVLAHYGLEPLLAEDLSPLNSAA